VILVFGSINIDLLAAVAAIPRPGETVLAERYETSPGGKGANQAVAAARARLDPALPVLMAGAVGADAFGGLARANLERHGVDARLVRTVAEPTGCAFISVDRRGENAITVASGANRAVRAADVPDAILRQTRVAALQMEVPAAENAALARRARAAGAQVVLNLAPCPAGLGREMLAGMLGPGDVLVLNALEAEAVGDCCGVAREAPGGRAAAIARSLGVTCAVTLGAEGVVASAGGAAPIAQKALAVTPVDTTGAGDTFVGVLAARLAEGADLASSLRHAAAGASLACLGIGAQASMPDGAAIERALAGS
jgi:ribokinase